MYSTPRRANDSSQQALTYSGRPLMSSLPSSLLKPNLVARITLSRRPAMARPTRHSLCPLPYTLAVSRKNIPSSMARWIVAMDSCSSAGPYDCDMPMHPRPRVETIKPCLPSTRVGIMVSVIENSFPAHPEKVCLSRTQNHNSVQLYPACSSSFFFKRRPSHFSHDHCTSLRR